MSLTLVADWDPSWKDPKKYQQDALVKAILQNFSDPRQVAYDLYGIPSRWWYQIILQWIIMADETQSVILERMLGPEWFNVVQACRSVETIVLSGWEPERGWWNPPQREIPATEWVVHRLRVVWLWTRVDTLPIPMSKEFSKGLAMMCQFLAGPEWEKEFALVSPKYDLWKEKNDAPEIVSSRESEA